MFDANCDGARSCAKARGDTRPSAQKKLGGRGVFGFVFDFFEVLFVALGDVNKTADDAPGEAGGVADEGEEQGGGGFDVYAGGGKHQDVEVFANAEAAGRDGERGDARDGRNDFR